MRYQRLSNIHSISCRQVLSNGWMLSLAVVSAVQC